MANCFLGNVSKLQYHYTYTGKNNLVQDNYCNFMVLLKYGVENEGQRKQKNECVENNQFLKTH